MLFKLGSFYQIRFSNSSERLAGKCSCLVLDGQTSQGSEAGLRFLSAAVELSEAAGQVFPPRSISQEDHLSLGPSEGNSTMSLCHFSCALQDLAVSWLFGEASRIDSSRMLGGWETGVSAVVHHMCTLPFFGD